MNKAKRITALLLTLFVLIGALTGCSAANKESAAADLTPISAGGNIVATSVAIEEILDKMEVDHVVGIPHTDAFQTPERYQNAKEIGSPMSPNTEIVKSLNPEIVLSPKSLEGQLKDGYDNVNLRSYFVDLESVDGMYASITELGKLLGKEAEAAKLNEDYTAYKKTLTASHSSDTKPKVLILMGLPGSFVAATESSYVGSLVKLAGGENVYGDGNGTDFLEINTEDMLQTDPDIILRTSHAMPEKVQAMFAKEFKTNDIWKHFRAVQNDKVYDLEYDKFGMSARFNYPEAVSELEGLLYA